MHTYAQDKQLPLDSTRFQSATPQRKYIPPHLRKNPPAAPKELPEQSCKSPPKKTTRFPSEKKKVRSMRYGKKPDLTPSAVRSSLRRKYEKDPLKFQKIYFSVFPKPVDTSRYEQEISRLARFTDPMTKMRIDALLRKIRNLRERHARRLLQSDQIVHDYITKRIERWEQLHKKPYATEDLLKASLEDDTVSYLSSCLQSTSSCSISTQTDSEASISFDSESDSSDLETEQLESVSVSIQTEKPESVTVSTQTNAVQEDPLVPQLERQITILTSDNEQLKRQVRILTSDNEQLMNQIDFHENLASGRLKDPAKKMKNLMSIFKKK
jgi:hypothetical protein